MLALRGQLISEITRLQNQIETEMLEANAVVAASRVLDEASLVPQSPLRRAALSLGSGLIGGLGIGLGLVMRVRHHDRSAAKSCRRRDGHGSSSDVQRR